MADMLDILTESERRKRQKAAGVLPEDRLFDGDPSSAFERSDMLAPTQQALDFANYGSFDGPSFLQRWGNILSQPLTREAQPGDRGVLFPGKVGDDGKVQAAVPGMIAEPIESWNRMVDAPIADIMRNQDRGAIEQLAVDSFNVAGALPMAGVAVGKAVGTPMVQDNAAGIFGGRLAKTADQAALKRAEDLAAKGMPREDIWSDTGWFQGPDGKWRFEIDDSKARVSFGKLIEEQSGSVSDFFRHSDLFAAYPVMADRSMSYGDDFRSSFNPRTKEIKVGGSPDMGALHESQHALQDIEGFSSGASSSAEGYRRRAGEVEARTVEKRANLTAAERRARPPWLDYDVPEGQQIVRSNPDDVTTAGVLNLMDQGSLQMDQASRMARAREMGFDTDTTFFHGTRSAGFDEFGVPDKYSELRGNDGWNGVSVSPDPAIASQYSGVGTTYAKRAQPLFVPETGLYSVVEEVPHDFGKGTGAVYNLNTRVQNPFRMSVDDAFGRGFRGGGIRDRYDFSTGVAREGYDAIDIMDGDKIVERVVLDPRNIRSVNAAFDPAKASSANLLAANPDDVTTAGVLNLMDQGSLPMDQASRMARAREMGFDTDTVWYRGAKSDREELKALPSDVKEPAVWFSKNPKRASEFAENRASLHNLLEIKAPDAFPSVMPAHLKGNYKTVEGWFQAPNFEKMADQMRGAKSEGYDGVIFKRLNDKPGATGPSLFTSDVLAAFDPRNIRSVNAAFDPAKANSANLLAANPDDVTTAGILNLMDQGQQPAKGITAYHGSPHDFDRFSLDKIGTGEGAQAYGHGLYFAENEGVARSYRDALAADQMKIGKDKFVPGNYAINGIVAKHRSDLPKLESELRAYAVENADNEYADVADAIKVADSIRDGTFSADVPGRMYEVRINAEPDDFLDWDKPLSQQSEKVRKIYDEEMRSKLKQREIGSNPNFGPLIDVMVDGGGSLGVFTRDNLADVLESPSRFAPTTGAEFVKGKEAALREAGIPGIRYLDQGSRTAGEGSRNYVVFDDALVEIMRKYMNPDDPSTAAILDLMAAEADRNRKRSQ